MRRHETNLSMTRGGGKAVALAVLVLAALPPADGTADTPVERVHTGTYQCTDMRDGSSCGSDRFGITVLADGSRLLQGTSYRAGNGGGVLAVTLHVDGQYRLIDAHTNIYNAGEWLGAGHFFADGAALRMSVQGPDEHYTLGLDAPGDWSMLLHPPAADGWHYAFYDHDRGGVQSHQVCTVGRLGRGVGCDFNRIELEYLGEERIEVPAGTFDTRYYRLGQTAEVWISGPDRVVVRHVFGAAGARTELTAWERSEAVQRTPESPAPDSE